MIRAPRAERQTRWSGHFAYSLARARSLGRFRIGVMDRSQKPPIRALFVRGEGGGETADYWKGETSD